MGFVDNVNIVAANIANSIGENIGVLSLNRATIADMIAIPNPSTDLTCIVTDKNQGGTFVYDSTQSTVNNGGTIFNGWIRQYDEAVNVKWFGAVGDGVTDDGINIQKALNVGEVDLTKGIYESSIKLTVNHNLKGIGIIKFTTNGTWDSLLLNADNLIVKDITIIGNEKQVGLQLGSTKNTNIKNVKIYNVYQAGINAYGAKNISIKNCYIENSVNGDGTNSYGDGIYLNATINAVVEDNEIYKFNRIGIVAEGANDNNSDNITIKNNTIHYGFNQNLSLDGVEFNVGIWVEHTSNFVIDNNYIYDIDTGINQDKAKVGGIQVGGGIQNVNTSIISNNNIVLPISSKTDSSEYLGFGIGLTGYSNLSNLLINNNKIVGFYGKGISIGGGYRNLTISNNYFEKCYFSANSHGYLIFQIDNNITKLSIDNNVFDTLSRTYPSNDEYICPDINFFSYTNPNMESLYINKTNAIIGSKFNNTDIKNTYITKSKILNGYKNDNNVYSIVGINRYIDNTEIVTTDTNIKYNHIFLEGDIATNTLITNSKFLGPSFYWENVYGFISISDTIFDASLGIKPNIKMFNKSGERVILNFKGNIINDYDTTYGLVFTNIIDEPDNIVILASNNMNISTNTNNVFKKYKYDISGSSVFENNISLTAPFSDMSCRNILHSKNIITSLPTTDSGVAGSLWNNNGVIVVSGIANFSGKFQDNAGNEVTVVNGIITAATDDGN